MKRMKIVEMAIDWNDRPCDNISKISNLRNVAMIPSPQAGQLRLEQPRLRAAFWFVLAQTRAARKHRGGR